MAISLKSVGTCVGEEEMGISELVDTYQASEEVIRRSLGRRTVRVTRGSVAALALRAATT